MNLRQKKRHIADGHGSPLNDILFVLLLFLLIMATMANPNIVPVRLPKGNSEVKAKQQSIVVEVTKDQQFIVDKRTISADTSVIFDSVRAAIATKWAQQSNDTTITVLVYGDKEATWENINHVLRAAQSLRLRSVAAVDKQ